MRSFLRGRQGRTLAGLGLAMVLVIPAAAPVLAADPVTLRVGSTQDLDSLNPYSTLLVVGYDAFQLTYNLLVDFGPDLEPVPGFADKWERAADGKSWSFHIRDGMTWSDGTPATAADACFSWKLGIDAINSKAGIGSLGAGYLDPGLDEAKVTAVECPDDSTMIVSTEDSSERVLQTYMPIIPKHIWGNETFETIGDAKFDAPLVGTGPYTVAEWQTGQFARFVRNESYWGNQAYPDEIVIQFFKSADPMIQALKAGEIDYARGGNAAQFDDLKSDPNIVTVAGAANGWTQLAFNTYGTGTGKTIEDGGPSTTALLDPAFRRALVMAVDHQTLVDRVLGGYGEVGTTIVPPVLTQWHVEPTNPLPYDPAAAIAALEAAGYPTDANGNRLDKDDKKIKLRMYFPGSDDNYPKVAQFIQEWYKALGIELTAERRGSATLGELVLPPEAGKKYNADYDIELWGWAWGIDPGGALGVFTCDSIGNSSDSQYCNPKFDELQQAQFDAATNEERHAILAEAQNLIYDEAPYDILYYDANLDAYRTDKFAGWQNQPTANGTPLFTYGTLGYTLLTDPNAVVATPEPSPGASAAAPSDAPTASATAAPTASGDGSGDTSSTSDSTPILIVIGLLILAAIVVAYGMSRRRKASDEDDDEDE
jgi:peptide/nickel transport system substrate-binding protein